MDNDIEIFKGKKFSSLCEDIYNNSTNKRDQIDILISELRLLIKGVPEAMNIVPLIKEYFDVAVRNDEHLVKLASVVQRIINSNSDEGSDGYLSESEKDQLLREVSGEVKMIKDEEKKLSAELKTIESKKKEIISKEK
jgi:hypothetical protein